MKNKILAGLASLLSLITLVAADAGDEYGCGMMGGVGGMMTGVYGTGGMLFGWLFSILVLVVLILLIAWLIKQIQKKQ